MTIVPAIGIYSVGMSATKNVWSAFRSSNRRISLTAMSIQRSILPVTEIQCMLDTLAEREKCYTALFPWDHANYGMDEHWIRCYPYEQEVAPGETAQLRVEITNHSYEPRTAIAQPILLGAWDMELSSIETTIPPRSDGHIDFFRSNSCTPQRFRKENCRSSRHYL